jgi:hypothetical protein|tara:strand:- start:516 stop:953 length:438 start_codon:yes stop_codon:yes gene_type:complete
MALSTIGTNAITDATIATGDIANGAVTLGKVDATSTEANNLKQRVCKAWVDLDGGGSAHIDDDFNVASITDNGTGDYTITYSAAMGSADYAVAGSVVGSNSDSYYSFVTSDGSVKSTASCRIGIIHHGGSLNDQGAISVIVFGDS